MSEDIHIRHADVLRRVRELEAEVAHFQAEYQDAVGRTELIRNVETLKADVATLKSDNADLRKSWDEMQAEVLRLTDERDAAMKLVELRTADLGSVAAERDRLKTALEWIAGLSRVGLNIGAAIQEAERALASNPSTEEGDR